MKLILFITIIIIFFSGCSYTVYHPVPPKDFEGKQCVKLCELDHYNCSIEENKKRSRCERKNERRDNEYLQCVRENKNIYKEVNRYCSNSKNKLQCEKDQMFVYKQTGYYKTCQKPLRRYCNSVNLGCENRYKKCFINCGGSYISEEKELF